MLEEDKKDISEYLKWSIAAKKDELEELESRQQAIEQDRDALKLQHNQEMEELQEQLNELNSVTLMQGEAMCHWANVCFSVLNSFILRPLETGYSFALWDHSFS